MPRQLIAAMVDIHGDFMMEELDNASTVSLAQDQIRALGEGTTSELNMRAYDMLMASILTRSRGLFHNRLHKVFIEEFENQQEAIKKLKEKSPEDLTKKEKRDIKAFERLESMVMVDQVVEGKDGKPTFVMKKHPQGWKPIYWYENGTKNRAFMDPQLHRSFTDTNNNLLNSTTREAVAIGSGTRFVKLLATGKNPAFFVTNMPRDFLFTLTFSPEYGNFVPVEALKLIRDATKGMASVLGHKKDFKKFLEYGGGMDFLVLQGKNRPGGIADSWAKGMTAITGGRNKIGLTKKIFKAIDRFNLGSEMAIRLAVFNKSVANQMRERGMKPSQIETLPKKDQVFIYTKAIKSARELTDFNQGGRVAKAMDAAFPYLNAAVQGTRAAFEQYKRRPFETTFRIAQGVGITVSATVFGSLALIAKNRGDDDEEKLTEQEIYFQTLEQVSEYDLLNYFIIPMGKKDDRGNWRYYRIAKAQTLTPFINGIEAIQRRQMAELNGIPYEDLVQNPIWKSVEKNILPMEIGLGVVGRVPLASAWMNWNGIDAFTGKPLDWRRGEIPVQYEGAFDDRVEQFYKELGEQFEWSPVRMKKVTESFVTTPSTNPYVGLSYATMDFLTSRNLNEAVGGVSSQGSNLWEQVSKRVVKSGSVYNEVSKIKERASDVTKEAYGNALKMENTVREAIDQYKKDRDADALEEVIMEQISLDPLKAKKVKSWAKSQIKKEKLHPFTSSIAFTDNPEVKAILLFEKFGDEFLNKDIPRSKAEKTIMLELVKSGALDKSTIQYYKRIIGQDKKGTPVIKQSE